MSSPYQNPPSEIIMIIKSLLCTCSSTHVHVAGVHACSVCGMHMLCYSDFRGEYITKKYLQRKYIEHSIGKEGLLQELADAVDSRDIKQLLQVYAEGVDMCAPLPSYAGGLTALHLAIELEDLTSLHVVDFLLGNG